MKVICQSADHCIGCYHSREHDKSNCGHGCSNCKPVKEDEVENKKWLCGTKDCVCNENGECDCHNFTKPLEENVKPEKFCPLSKTEDGSCMRVQNIQDRDYCMELNMHMEYTPFKIFTVCPVPEKQKSVKSELDIKTDMMLIKITNLLNPIDEKSRRELSGKIETIIKESGLK